MDPVHRAVIAAMECGAPPMTFVVGGDAQVHLDDRHDGSHLLTGATIATWPVDE